MALGVHVRGALHLLSNAPRHLNLCPHVSQGVCFRLLQPPEPLNVLGKHLRKVNGIVGFQEADRIGQEEETLV